MPVRSLRAVPRRGRWRVGAAVTIMLVAAGCTDEVIDGQGAPVSGTGSGTATANPTVPAGEFTWGETAGETTNLLPLILDGNTTATANLTVRVLDGLYRISPQIAYVADPDQGTATSGVVGGQQVVDITINPKAVWADGQPITADDYAFTISSQRSTNPAAGGCAALLSTAGFDQVERTEKVDSKHLKVYFKTPFADWKGLFAGAAGASPLLSKHVMDKGSPTANCGVLTNGWPVAEGIPLGAQNGPWLLTQDNVNTTTKTITLLPNPRYWGDKPKLALLTYRTIGDTAAAVSALRSGDVDAVYPTPQLDVLSRLKQTTGVATTVGVGSTFEHLDFNTLDPLLKYPQIRQAIALAIDRKALTAQTVGTFSDRATPLGNHLLVNTQTGYADNSGQYNSQNVATAKRLIESVGGKLGSDGVYTLGGRRLAFRVMTTQNNAVRAKTIAVLAQQVQAAGIQLTAFPNPDIFLDADRPTSLAAGGFQIALFAWVGSPSVSSLNSIYYSSARSGVENFGKGGTPAVDKALDAVATASTSTAQTAAANAADRLLWDGMWTLPLYQKPTVLAYSDKVKGLADNVSFAGPLWNSDEITVK